MPCKQLPHLINKIHYLTYMFTPFSDSKYSHAEQQCCACQETRLHTLRLCNPSPLIRRDKVHSLDHTVCAAPSPNPSGPPQHKQKQTEEFSSQHVILHAAPNRRNKFRTMVQQSQSPWIRICLDVTCPHACLDYRYDLFKCLCLKILHRQYIFMQSCLQWAVRIAERNRSMPPLCPHTNMQAGWRVKALDERNLSVQLSERKDTLTHTVSHCELAQGCALNW